MNNKNFLKSSAILFVGDLLTKILGFIYLAPLARIDVGIGSISGYLMTPYSFFITFSVMGITSVMMYKLGPAIDNKDEFKRHFFDGTYYVLITSSIITLGLLIFAKPLMESVTPESIPYVPDLVVSLQIISVSIIFYAINTLIRSVMLSKNYVTIISVTYITEQLVKLIILLAGCYYFITIKGQDVIVSSYVTAWSVTISVVSTTAILVGYSLKIKLFDFLDGAKYKWSPSSFKAIFTLGAVYFINSIFINGFNQIDLLMFADSLARIDVDPIEIDLLISYYFSWSWKLIMVVITLGGVFITIMVQQITRAKSKSEKILEMKNVLDFMILFTMLATTFFLTAGKDFYELFYPTSDGVEILVVQALVIVPVMIRMLLSVFAVTIGKRRIVLFSTAIIFIAKIILNPILFYFFEIYGFVYASIIASILSIAFMLILDTNIFQFTKQEYFAKARLFIRMLILHFISIIFASFIHKSDISTFVSFIIISVEILVLFALFNIRAIKRFRKIM